MTIADEIPDLLKRKRPLKLAAPDIAEMLYWGDKASQQRVKAECVALYDQQRLLRDGRGSLGDPYVYRLAPIERRPSRAVAIVIQTGRPPTGLTLPFASEENHGE